MTGKGSNGRDYGVGGVYSKLKEIISYRRRDDGVWRREEGCDRR